MRSSALVAVVALFSSSACATLAVPTETERPTTNEVAREVERRVAEKLARFEFPGLPSSPVPVRLGPIEREPFENGGRFAERVAADPRLERALVRAVNASGKAVVVHDEPAPYELRARFGRDVGDTWRSETFKIAFASTESGRVDLWIQGEVTAAWHHLARRNTD